MANIKSQKKRVLTNEKAHQRNRAVKSGLKTATKKVEIFRDLSPAQIKEFYTWLQRRDVPAKRGRQSARSSRRRPPSS